MMLSRDEIYTQLEAEIPYIRNHECTPRVMSRVDFLLDRLLEVQDEEFSTEVQEITDGCELLS